MFTPQPVQNTPFAAGTSAAAQGAQAGITSIPIPSGTSVRMVASDCGNIPQGPTVQFKAQVPPKQCEPQVLYDECEDELVIIDDCGNLWRFDSCTQGTLTFAKDESGCALKTMVPVFDVCGMVYTRKTTGEARVLDPSDGTWSVTTCPPIVEASALREVTAALDSSDGTVVLHAAIAPDLACYQEVVTDDFCVGGV